MPNPSLTSANTTGFVCIKHAITNQIQKIATTADFQIGLSNVPANLTITGGDLTSHATTFNLLNEPTTLNIGSTAVTRTTNIATGAAVQTVTLGSTTGASSLTLNAGTGGIKKPNQPAFLAYMSATQVGFANNIDVTVLFNSEVFDQAGNFNTTTNTFTAPVTGRYIFNVSVRLDDVHIAATYYTAYLVTSNRTYRAGLVDPKISATNLLYLYLNGSVIADMDTSDTAYVVIRQQAGTTATTDITAGNNSPQIDSYFSGFLLG